MAWLLKVAIVKMYQHTRKIKIPGQIFQKLQSKESYAADRI